MDPKSIKACEVRRAELLHKLAPNSIAIVPAANLATRSNDTEFAFRQDSDFHYLSHFPEPDGLLVMSNSEALGGSFCAIFCHEKDPLAEIWHGRRFGPDVAKQHFKFDDAHGIESLAEGLLHYVDAHDNIYLSRGHHIATDQKIDEVLNQLRNAPKQSKIAPKSEHDLRTFLHEMRLVKSPYEISLMRTAADISCQAHTQAMRAALAGKNEYHLEAILHYEFAANGAKYPAYGTIVGSGENACILHYTENNSELKDGDLILIDAGAEYMGYASDITRTFPVNGTFTAPQKQLYQLVLDAQLASLAKFKPGNTFKMANDCAIDILTKGLITLGLLDGDVESNIAQQSYRQFFMHGLGHWLGLDVHDVGDYKLNGVDRTFVPGMVLTVEPGLYVSNTADVDDKWRGLGIRIEDNIVITSDGYELLTDGVPKSIEGIESLMKSG